MTIQELAQQKVLVLDGAMGTMIQKYHLSEADFRGLSQTPQHPVPTMAQRIAIHADDMLMKGNNDVLNLTRPDVILDIHRRYLAAGADLIETNTFSSQRISQADYHLEHLAREMALAGARIARKAANEANSKGRNCFVCGSVGPTNKTATMSPDINDPAFRDVTFDMLFDAYFEQIDALVEGGVDAILIETIFDTLNAKAAIGAASQVMERHHAKLPLMLSLSVSDNSGRILSGQNIDAFLASISSYDVFSVGLNCSFGAAQMKPFIQHLAQHSPYYISAYPNAGMPNSLGDYDETAESMSPQIAEYLNEGLINIIGGCCGTDETFIKRYCQLAKGKNPHHPNPKKSERHLLLSGLDALCTEGSFVNVGERCNVAGSRKFLRLIQEKKYQEALSIARRQVEQGAMVIDVNMDDGLLDAPQEMTTFLRLIAGEPEIAKVPVMIDSSNWTVIVEGLKCLQGKSIVNSISLKEGEQVFVEHAREVKRHGAAVVVMCFDEQGQATTYERRIEIASRSYHILTEQVGFLPEDIIIDPNVLAVATGMDEHNSYAADFIKATAWICSNLPGAHVSGGVSNLSFAFRGNNYIRECMHAVFLYHAIQAGMDMAIVNPTTKITYDDIPAGLLSAIEDVILNRSADAPAHLVTLANEFGGKAAASQAPVSTANAEEEWRNLPLEQRLEYALRKGIGDYIESDIQQALKVYPHAVDIIEGPLMQGMNRVGELFGEGKMFLPQVVKAARTMKIAVSVLQPYIERERSGTQSSRGKVILATVKGDVHDIGKNIVAVVMACNNFEVVDLGVMVPAERIISSAIAEKACAIGLSGLITPSLEEMVHVAREMERSGLHIPILIGGATTSEMHVALKIAPEYNGTVAWMKDAAQNVVSLSRMLNAKECEDYRKELEQRYQTLRESYQQEQSKLVSLNEARNRKLELFN